MDKPNIVFIQSDSMDGRVMGCAGHAAAHTPNLDGLAEQGVLFANAYCNSPQCCPSRASMWSGRHVHTVEAWSNHKGLDPDRPTFQTALEDAGYRTAILGRTDHVAGAHTLANFLAVCTRAAGSLATVKGPPRAEVVADKAERVRTQDWERVDDAVRWLRENARESRQPFFLHLGFTQPHPGADFRASPHWIEKIDPQRVSLPEKNADIHPAMAYMRATKNCAEDLPDEEVLRIRRHYFAMIAELDAMVGRVVGAAEELGLSEDTWFVFTADHGEMALEHGQYLKNALYEPSARVPLVARGPGARRGAVVESSVSLLDVFPTLMDMAGAAHSPSLEGRSLAPAMAGKALENGSILSQYHSNMQDTGSFMLREGDCKYIAYVGFEPQLFNLREDPGEMRNLAAERPGEARRMDAALREMVDIDAVDARAKAWDRAAFRRWRAEVGEAAYRGTMADTFRGLSETDFARVEEWLRKD